MRRTRNHTPIKQRPYDAIANIQRNLRRRQAPAPKRLGRLEAGDIRDAAEKAWCATKRATDALILARTEEMPGTTAITTACLDDLAREDEAVKPLVGRYYSRIHQLHGQCFYNGFCQPVVTERRIRETGIYIDDAERLAGPR